MSIRLALSKDNTAIRHLLDKYRWFDEEFDAAIQHLPGKLRTVINKYSAANQRVSDTEIIDHLKLESIDIPADGPIDCWANNDLVIEHLDISLEFSKSKTGKMEISKVKFDG